MNAFNPYAGEIIPGTLRAASYSPAGGDEMLLVNPADARIVKPIGIDPRSRIQMYHDTMPLVTGATQYRFFVAPNPANPKAVQNIRTIPLAGAYARDVLSLKVHFFTPTLTGIYDAAASGAKPHGKTGWLNNVNPTAILNTLEGGYVTMKADQGESQLFTARLSDLIQGQRELSVANVTTNKTQQTLVFNTDFFRLSDPFRINQNQVFEFYLEFEDTAGLPSAADWTAHGEANGFRLGFTIQVAEFK